MNERPTYYPGSAAGRFKIVCWRTRSIAIVFGLLVAGTASAQDMAVQVAESRKLGIQIMAERAAWCAPQPTFRIAATRSEVFQQPDLAATLQRLGTALVARTCPTMQSLQLIGQVADQPAILWRASAAAADGWIVRIQSSAQTGDDLDELLAPPKQPSPAPVSPQPVPAPSSSSLAPVPRSVQYRPPSLAACQANTRSTAGNAECFQAEIDRLAARLQPGSATWKTDMERTCNKLADGNGTAGLGMVQDCIMNALALRVGESSGAVSPASPLSASLACPATSSGRPLSKLGTGTLFDGNPADLVSLAPGDTKAGAGGSFVNTWRLPAGGSYVLVCRYSGTPDLPLPLSSAAHVCRQDLKSFVCH